MFFHKYKISTGLYNGEKRNSTLGLSWPTYSRRGIRAQKNSGSWCGVFNSDRNQIRVITWKEATPFRNTLILKFWIPQRYIGGLRKFFQVYIAKGVALTCVSPNKNLDRFTQNPVHPVHSPLFCNLKSLLICRLPKRLKCTIVFTPKVLLIPWLTISASSEVWDTIGIQNTLCHTSIKTYIASIFTFAHLTDITVKYKNGAEHFKGQTVSRWTFYWQLYFISDIEHVCYMKYYQMITIDSMK